MQPTTRVWSGWIGAMPDDGATRRLTWEQWRAWQRQSLEQKSPRDAASSGPGRLEIAIRAFLAWFDAAASSGPQESPFDDREVAVRSFMREHAAVVATSS
jgi:hypothetical protein